MDCYLTLASFAILVLMYTRQRRHYEQLRADLRRRRTDLP